MTENLEDIIVEARRQREEVDALLRDLDDGAFLHRPDPDRWSAGEHIAHIPLTDRPYLERMEAALERARERGQLSAGPFRGRPLGNWFARSMEPPVKRRFKTMKRLEPSPELDRQEVRADFARCREELIEVVERGAGVDFDRASIRSPYMKLLKMPVYSACNVLLAHGRRHIWLARETLGSGEGVSSPPAP